MVRVYVLVMTKAAIGHKKDGKGEEEYRRKARTWRARAGEQ